MKKFFGLILALVVTFSLAACNETTAKKVVTKEGLTYAEWCALADDSEATVTAYVQACQTWWDEKITVYLADKDGAYFAYNMVCSKDDAAKLVPGTMITVKGTKTTWSGETEFASGCTFNFVQGGDTYIAPAYDVTSIVGNETELIKHQNELVLFKGAAVSKAYLYNWDGSGSEGDDLYFNVTIGGNEYTFTVESYLCDKNSDVYKAVKELKVGDVIDLEGFCYWYNGLNPHITKVTLK